MRLGSIEGGTADRRKNEITSAQNENENEKHLKLWLPSMTMNELKMNILKSFHFINNFLLSSLSTLPVLAHLLGLGMRNSNG